MTSLTLPFNKQMDESQRVIKDQYGRHVIYHGVNVVYKVAPYLPDRVNFDPQDSLTEKDIFDLQNWGVNLVRLGVMWEAVESAPGVYNQTYLKQIDDLITKLGEAGIYTLLDAHQDVMARTICGEGMPNFYANEILANGSYCVGKYSDYIMAPLLNAVGFCKPMDNYKMQKDQDGNPLISDCQRYEFFHYYLSPESFTIFRELWTNKNGLQDKYVAYWDVMAKNLAKNEYVVGFDPINEPIPSWTNVPMLFWKMLPETGYFDKHDLQPMYSRIYETYSRYNNKSRMWFEPAQVPD